MAEEILIKELMTNVTLSLQTSSFLLLTLPSAPPARFVTFDLSWSMTGGISIYLNNQFVKREINFVPRAVAITKQVTAKFFFGRPALIARIGDVRFPKIQIETVQVHNVIREALVKAGLAFNGENLIYDTVSYLIFTFFSMYP